MWIDIVAAGLFATMTALNARNYKVAKETKQTKIEKASAGMVVLGSIGTIFYTARAIKSESTP